MDAVVTMGALVGAIWGMVALLRTHLWLGGLVVVLVSASFGYAFFFAVQLGPFNWTLDRLMLVWLIAAFVIQRYLGRTDTTPLGVSEWLVVGLLGWLTVSLVSHDYLLEFGESATPLWRWATGYVIPALLYWIAWHARPSERTMGKVYTLLVLFGVYLGVTGLLEITHQWSLVFPRHIADPLKGIHFGRARGPMLSSVTYGLFLGVSLLTLWATRARLWRSSQLMLPLLLSPLFLAGLYVSYTRSVWMGAGLGLVTVLTLTTRGRTRLLLLATLLGAALLVGITKTEELISVKREQTAEEARGSAEARLSFAYVSWRMFQDHPLLGVGFGQFPMAKMPYLSDRTIDLPLEAVRPLIHHNTILSLLVETGIIGLSLFLGMLAAWGRNAWLLYRNDATPSWIRRQAVLMLGVLGLYLCQFGFHEISYSTQDNCLLFLLAGMTASLRRVGPGDAGDPRMNPSDQPTVEAAIPEHE